ncbi:hypothetical protein [Sphingobium fluviale]|nr:hypothetical protein [Sphingobium fluviale]
MAEVLVPEQAGFDIPTRETLVARAQALVPILRERARHEEQDRKLSDESVAQIAAAGFPRILQPKRFGGYGLNWDAAVEVISTIGASSGSAGWITNLFILHNYQVALFPLQAQEEYWANGADVCCSTVSTSIRSELEHIRGGFRLSGHWKFASGCDFADWFIVMKPNQTCFDWMLVPRCDVTICDDWFVSGLCATGSRDILLDNVFVPEHRVIRFDDLIGGSTPGGKLNELPLARLSFYQVGIWTIPAALIGMARGMADAVQHMLVNKRALLSGALQHERVANHIKLGEVHANIDAATLVMRNRIARLNELDQSSEPALVGAEAYASQRDAAYVGRLVVQAANTLSLMAGASAVYLANPVQRFLRDISVGATHATLGWEEAAENYGRALWNLP